MQRLAVVCLLAAGLLACSAAGVRQHWTMSGGSSLCTEHPARGTMLDGSITFHVTSLGAPATDMNAVCSGDIISIEVTYPSKRAYLLTSSVGDFASDSANEVESTCPNRLQSRRPASSVRTTLKVPCGTTDPVQLKISTLNGETVMQNSMTLQVDNTCGPCSTEGVQPARRLLQSGFTAAGLNSATGCNAVTNSYKYACNRQIAGMRRGNWQLSYTVATTPTPPNNPCTSALQQSAASNKLPSGATHWVHFMVSAAVSGYVGFAYPEQVGAMVPADAIIGYPGSVDTYSLQQYMLPPADSNSWAYNKGSFTTSDGRTALCWSQPAVLSGNTQTSSSIVNMAQALQVNLAASSTSTDLSQQHNIAGGVTIDVTQGASTSSSTPTPSPSPASNTPTRSPSPAPSSTTHATSPAPSGSSSDSSSSKTSSGTNGTSAATTGTLTPESLNTALGCSKNSLYGYGCVRDMQLSGNWQLSYTVSTSPVPPANDCTKDSLAAAASKTLPSGANAWVHFMVCSTAPGWIALSFAGTANKMYGTAVMGGVNSATDTAYVDAYDLTGHFLPDPTTSPSWAQNMGAMTTSDGKTAICWSRPANIPSAGATRRLHQANGEVLTVTNDLPMSVASSSSDDTGTQHNFNGGYTLNMASGASAANGDETKKWVRIHAALMIAAFIGAMPTAILIARHRKFVPNVMVHGKAIWFWLHVLLQVAASALFLAGIIIAWTKFDDAEVPEAPDVMDLHKVLGIIILVFVGIQILIGFIRPGPDHKKRWIWNILHHNWGRLAVILAWINIATGIFLWDKQFDDWQGWVIAVCVIVGVQLLVEVLLQVFKCFRRSRESYTSQPPAMQLPTTTNGVASPTHVVVPQQVYAQAGEGYNMDTTQMMGHALQQQQAKSPMIAAPPAGPR